MAGSGIALGILIGAVATRFIVGRHMRRMFRGGGCGRWHGRHGEGRFAWRAGWRRGPAVWSSVAPRLDRIMAALELNGRQAEDVGEVFALLGEELALAPGRLGQVLMAIGSEPFDRERVTAALGPQPDAVRAAELLDGIEHIHNILTPEQRQKLRETVGT